MTGRLTACVLVALIGCARSEEPPAPLELETVDVGDVIDSELSTEADEKGQVPVDGDWILSGGIPDDLPLHRPARLVDGGETPDGRAYYVFHTATGPGAVRSGLERRLPPSGWSMQATGDGLTASRGSERVEFVFRPLEPGTEIRVVY